MPFWPMSSGLFPDGAWPSAGRTRRRTCCCAASCLACAGLLPRQTTAKLLGLVKAATWLAVNDPAGTHRTALAEAVRKHGHACLSVTASIDGLVWDMTVSSMEADLAPALAATDL